jgi:hypothetical protein
MDMKGYADQGITDIRDSKAVLGGYPTTVIERILGQPETTTVIPASDPSRYNFPTQTIPAPDPTQVITPTPTQETIDAYNAAKPAHPGGFGASADTLIGQVQRANQTNNPAEARREFMYLKNDNYAAGAAPKNIVSPFQQKKIPYKGGGGGGGRGGGGSGQSWQEFLNGMNWKI